MNNDYNGACPSQKIACGSRKFVFIEIIDFFRALR